jgi:hypothetical protein
MDNKLHIQPTIFIDSPSGEKSYGIRIYDEYAQAYDNTWKKLPKNDFEILRKISKGGNESILNMLQFVRDDGAGLYVGNQWYRNKDILKYFK